jgi:bifunctional non-homologous end joining protein LigD
MSVKISSPDKVMFPRDGYTKQDMVDYYLSVADVMLPHLSNHPLAMLRFNKGIDGERFFHKNAPDYFPDFIERAEMPTSKRVTKLPVVNNADALAYIANHNCVEFHVIGATADDLWHPDRIVFDLDPSIDDFEQVRQATHWTKDVLDEIGLASFVMTSGSRGMHIWVPLNRKADTEQVVGFAGAVADVLVARHPERLTTEFSKADRGDRIYLDVARNAPAQHAVCPYSLRAKDGAPVATPISWDELDDPELHPQRWTMTTVGERIASDPWKGLRKSAKGLGPAAKKLERLAPA